MGDGIRSPESTAGVNPSVSKKIVKKGIQVAVAGAFLAEAVAGCVPSQAASGLSADRSKNTSDKVSTIPTPPSLLTPDTTVYPFVVPAKSTIDSETRQITNANLLKLQNYLGLKEEDVKKYIETGSNKGIESFQVLPGGLIIAEGGPYGYTDEESINIIKEAVDSLIKIDPMIMKQLSRLGLKAIARDIYGWEPGGFFKAPKQRGMSFSFQHGVILDNPELSKDRIAYMSGLVEESYGMSLFPYLQKGILPEEYTFKGEERVQKIEFIKQWFKKHEFDLSFALTTYKYLRDIIENERFDLLFSDIKVTKALLAQGFFEQEYKEGKISPQDYEVFAGDFFYRLRQLVIDQAQSS